MSSPTAAPPDFAVISGAQVDRVLGGRHREVTGIIEAAYRAHGAGDTVNPPSYFLRFPDRPSSRIIALPASVGGGIGVDGLKWISSFPENVAAGLPRASAVLILNDPATGYPLACLESSIISAARTAASAALAADRLSAGRARPRRVGFFGVGLIARFIHAFLAGTGWEFDETGVYDLSREHSEGFAGYLERSGAPGTVTVHESAEALIRSSDLVVFATVAGEPHVEDPAWFDHHPLVLHVSLRDLAPEVVLAATNVVDDVEHCLKANTSLHLAEQRTGHRDFVHGTLYDVLDGTLRPPADRPVIFSPFGLGILDLALGKHVYDTVREAGELSVVDGFFHEMRRYG
ncbi:2,3-diaminopropionate biosynthesis protein SbnB [Streptomyces sp. XD-27]|uniref:2,3-diaminopropionate biosynthesis protein SbnB n=1 Tax=Streptomyces sp. XD-27 TaxID=3062779 RepID=UPI0026F46D2A|nr:2,3-diaminopropionate biosynthesis protein SbnB [Streptomyces sp. XD-27]WKX69499.1 2,3-diaminopropionate biosynthesis protein SbnB [Streptomyces sp. XD-27]